MLKLYDKNFRIWGDSYDVYKDRYDNYYFLKGGKWVTPAHQRYYPKYGFTFELLFKLTYSPHIKSFVPKRSILDYVLKDRTSGVMYHQPVVIKS